MQTNGHRQDEAKEKREAERAARRAGARLMDIIGLEAESGISRYTWRAWIRARRIESVKLGRTVRVPREAYEAFLRANRVEAR
jgi:excisionase family DNA binding protein